MTTTEDLTVFMKEFMDRYIKLYLEPLHYYVTVNPGLIDTVPGFLVNPEEVILHLGRTHIGIEFQGPEFINDLGSSLEFDVTYYDYSGKSCNILEKIIGFGFDPDCLSIPLPQISQDLICPTTKGFEKLLDLGWDFEAQNSILTLNTSTPHVESNQFSRIINSYFFDANDNGLATRQIKWLDLIPIKFDGGDPEIDSFRFDMSMYESLSVTDAHCTFPYTDEFKFKQLPKINRFIELWGNIKTSEPKITSFISKTDNQFLLTMKFGATAIFPELLCDWQSENRDSIQPDFFVVQPNGYADIVEFKLPHLGKKVVVGRPNREAFSSRIRSYIEQTRVYAEYFDDPNNRKWFEEKYGFKVYKPRRYLVVGRRTDFDSNIWREIQADTPNLEIITFDDLIDGVKAQFYQ